MNVFVLGAGLAGITTAVRLAEEGCAVDVVDAQDAPALGASFANGGHVAAGDAAPWSQPGLFAQFCTGVFQRGAPIRMRPGFHAASWGFIRASLAQARVSPQKRAAVLGALAEASLDDLDKNTSLRDDDYALTRRGVLRVYRTKSAFDKYTAESGGERLTPEACVEIEPALAGATLAGGIFFAGDRTGDAYLFAKHQARRAEDAGARFHFNERINALEHAGGRITHVVAERARHACDAVVVALGLPSAALLRPLGVRVSLGAVAGYSASMPALGGAPSIGITDVENRIVISRLGETLRIAGFGDFGHATPQTESPRARHLLRAYASLCPQSGAAEGARIWAGVRAMTPDGLPIIGRAPGFENLYIHTGLGALGWTLCHRTARMTADMMLGRATTPDPAPFSPDRF